MDLQVKIYTRKNDSGTHYARIVVPKALRLFVAKPALWRSLSTKDDKDAVEAGSIVAASTQLVLQEVSDANAEAVVVTVATELVGNKFDLGKVLEKISQEDIALVAQSLREKFGIKTDDADKPKGGANKKTKDAYKKVDSKTGDAGEEIKMAQSDAAQLNVADVVRYIEKRPYGVYRFRFWIPNKLQEIFGQREVRKTLKTGNKKEAICRARPLLTELIQQLQQLSTPA